MRFIYRSIFGFILLWSSQYSLAQPLKLIGVFSQLAVFSQNGSEFSVRKGETHNDIFLQKTDPKQGSAMITLHGKTKKLHLLKKSNMSNGSKEVIEADENRLYYTYGKINKQSAIFLVDTGASHVTMNSKQAERLKLNYKKVGYPVQSITASGVHPAYALKLSSVSVGNVKVENVSALVLDGSMPKTILLGMSFIEHIKLKTDGNILTLSN